MAIAKTIEPDQDHTHPVVELRVRATPDQLSVLDVSSTTTSVDSLGERSFAWHVLNALTDSVDLKQEPDPATAGFVTTMEFTKVKNGLSL
ncbi:MAG: hypothetical protein EOP25_04835 [Rhodococcus sp. (in: high G+C Gram-positive bacteria)]|nr:MAG: hypothetical protein EOP25_04835 [Rhodococcus sp. (in: high G+C Gram-positive bacteria)]